MLVDRDSLHDGRGADERVVAAVQPARRPFERDTQAHDAMRPHLSPGLASLVELDDEAA